MFIIINLDKINSAFLLTGQSKQPTYFQVNRNIVTKVDIQGIPIEYFEYLS